MRALVYVFPLLEHVANGLWLQALGLGSHSKQPQDADIENQTESHFHERPIHHYHSHHYGDDDDDDDDPEEVHYHDHYHNGSGEDHYHHGDGHYRDDDDDPHYRRTPHHDHDADDDYYNESHDWERSGHRPHPRHHDPPSGHHDDDDGGHQHDADVPVHQHPHDNLNSAEGISWVGCFIDDNQRDFERMMGINHTTKSCKAACFSYHYMALQHIGQCWCGSSYRSRSQYRQVADVECESYCPGELMPNALPHCGTLWRNAVYDISGGRVLVTPAAAIANASNSSTNHEGESDAVERSRPNASRHHDVESDDSADSERGESVAPSRTQSRVSGEADTRSGNSSDIEWRTESASPSRARSRVSEEAEARPGNSTDSGRSRSDAASHTKPAASERKKTEFDESDESEGDRSDTSGDSADSGRSRPDAATHTKPAASERKETESDESDESEGDRSDTAGNSTDSGRSRSDATSHTNPAASERKETESDESDESEGDRSDTAGTSDAARYSKQRNETESDESAGSEDDRSGPGHAKSRASEGGESESDDTSQSGHGRSGESGRTKSTAPRVAGGGSHDSAADSEAGESDAAGGTKSSAKEKGGAEPSAPRRSGDGAADALGHAKKNASHAAEGAEAEGEEGGANSSGHASQNKSASDTHAKAKPNATSGHRLFCSRSQPLMPDSISSAPRKNMWVYPSSGNPSNLVKVEDPHSILDENRFLSIGDTALWVGCYRDNETRAFQCRAEGKTTTTGCMEICKGYLFMALQHHGQCWCGNRYSTGPLHKHLEDGECGTACDGEGKLSPSRYCGDVWTNAVYRLDAILLKDDNDDQEDDPAPASPRGESVDEGPMYYDPEEDSSEEDRAGEGSKPRNTLWIPDDSLPDRPHSKRRKRHKGSQ